MSAKPINGRGKGAAGERELARLLHAELGVTLHRNLEQSRGGGYDLVATGDDPAAKAMGKFALECKRYKETTPGLINLWWIQAEKQARQAGKIPVLCYRGDRREWRFCVPLSSLSADVYGAWNGYEWAAEMSLLAFCCLVRSEVSADG